jgi:hypothetical protein
MTVTAIPVWSGTVELGTPCMRSPAKEALVGRVPGAHGRTTPENDAAKRVSLLGRGGQLYSTNECTRFEACPVAKPAVLCCCGLSSSIDPRPIAKRWQRTGFQGAYSNRRTCVSPHSVLKDIIQADEGAAMCVNNLKGRQLCYWVLIDRRHAPANHAPEHQRT